MYINTTRVIKIKFILKVLMLLFVCELMTGCETMLGHMFTATISNNRSLANRKNYRQQMIASRPIDHEDDDEYEVLVRKKGVLIEPSDMKNTTGSLANSQDPRNNLFLSQDPIEVGNYLDVLVVFNRKQQADQNPEQAQAQAQDQNAGQDNSDIADILAMLPSLDPSDPSIAVLTSVKMKVTQVLPSGDVLVAVRRSSRHEGTTYDFIATGRIEYKNLSAGRDLTTQDLVDVTWFENDNDYVSEKYSSIWEDEYSLRLSGFKETESKYAMELKEKERQLKEAKSNLESRLKNFQEEKKQFRKKQQKALQAESKAQTNKDENKAQDDNTKTATAVSEASENISRN